MTNYNAEFKAHKAGRNFVNFLAGIIILPFALAFIAIFGSLWLIFMTLWLCAAFILWFFGKEIELKRNGAVFASLKWFKLTRY